MTFILTRDESLFKQVYDDERKLPRWFIEGSNNWGVTWNDFKSFCDKCERIYSINGTALIYAERFDGKANVHFSVIRGTRIDITDLVRVRDDLLTCYGMLFAYVGKHNRGLKKIVEQCGMKANGLIMYHGQSHGKLLEWHCFTVTKNSLENTTKL